MKDNYFISSDGSMLLHGCGVSNFHSFIKETKIYQILPRPHVVSYEDRKGGQFLKEKWIVDLEKSVEIFRMVSISDPAN